MKPLAQNSSSWAFPLRQNNGTRSVPVPGHVCHRHSREPPHYLFLSNLSFSDLCFPSAPMPKLLQNMQSQVLSIPYADCLAQIYFHLLFGVREIFLLVTMAYDHHLTPPALHHHHELQTLSHSAGAVRGADHCLYHAIHSAHG